MSCASSLSHTSKQYADIAFQSAKTNLLRLGRFSGTIEIAIGLNFVILGCLKKYLEHMDSGQPQLDLSAEAHFNIARESFKNGAKKAIPVATAALACYYYWKHL